MKRNKIIKIITTLIIFIGLCLLYTKEINKNYIINLIEEKQMHVLIDDFNNNLNNNYWHYYRFSQ